MKIITISLLSAILLLGSASAAEKTDVPTKYAENKNYTLFADDCGNISLKSRRTGFVWYSSPPDSADDPVATPLIAGELQSSNILRYGIPDKSTNNNFLRSATDCETSVRKIKGGVRVTYDYTAAGISFPVDYLLESDCLRVRLKMSDIQERDPANIATEISLMPSFGAESDGEGCFVVPDGCGAEIGFNNGRTSDVNAYSRFIYGSDLTAVPTSIGAAAEQLYLPMYGIIKEDNAMLVVAEKGDSNAYLTAKVSGQSNSSYNLCGFTFVLRDTDTFYMSGKVGDKVTVFEEGDIKADDIELLYCPIDKPHADFTDIAARYRSYLLDSGGVTVRAQSGKAPMYVGLYGGVLKDKPVFGIPVTVKQAVTSFGEAADILGSLCSLGADNIVATYDNWTDSGIESKVDRSAVPSSVLGGRSGFGRLTELVSANGIELYPVCDNREFFPGGGFTSLGDTCVRISGSYTRVVSYDRAYGIPDGFRDNMSLLTPQRFAEVIGAASADYTAAGLEGISLGKLSYSLYGDYGKRNISRYTAKKLITAAFADTADSHKILADTANAYLLPYVSHVKNIPVQSSRFDIFTADVPLLQIVLHGVIPYSCTAVNGAADRTDALLTAAATGSLLNYDLLSADISELKDTEYDEYYYAGAAQADRAAAEYTALRPMYAKTADSTIVEYAVENGGKLVRTVFSNGTSVEVDYTKKTVSCDGKLIYKGGAGSE